MTPPVSASLCAAAAADVGGERHHVETANAAVTRGSPADLGFISSSFVEASLRNI